MELLNNTFEALDRDREATRDVIEAIGLMHDNPDRVEVYAGDFLVVKDGAEHDIIRERLEADPYVLGCMADWIIGDALGVSSAVINKMQSHELYGEIGELILATNGALDACVDALISYDGAGHELASYDGTTREISFFDARTNCRVYYNAYRVN